MTKKYEVYIEADKDCPENTEWVIFEGSRRMAQAFKEGAVFAEGGEEKRRYRIRLKKKEQEWVKQKIVKRLLVLHKGETDE